MGQREFSIFLDLCRSRVHWLDGPVRPPARALTRLFLAGQMLIRLAQQDTDAGRTRRPAPPIHFRFPGSVPGIGSRDRFLGPRQATGPLPRTRAGGDLRNLLSDTPIYALAGVF